MKSKFIAFFLFLSITINAQFNNLHNFSHDNNLKGPVGGYVTDGKYLYGMTSAGGKNDEGTIYKMNLDGQNITYLHEFSGVDGQGPESALTISDTMLYGITYRGGLTEQGVIFKVSVNGNAFTKLLDFDGENGGYSYCSLSIEGDTIFGMSTTGGKFKKGTLFKLRTNGSSYIKLLDFNSEIGYWPYGALTVTDSLLYGTTRQGGYSDAGVIFSIHRDGTGFKRLFDFSSMYGKNPTGTLILLNNKLFGLTRSGGDADCGTIFQIDLNGVVFSKIQDFNSLNANNPTGSLILAGSKLYGITSNGGELSGGIIFKIGIDGKDFRVVKNLACFPVFECNPLLVDSSVYGISRLGGTKDWGVIFKCDTTGLNYKEIISIGSTSSGSTPIGNLVSDGKRLYGLTTDGGQNGYGILYSINFDGTDFRIIMNFIKEHGYMEQRNSLVLSDSTIFWTSWSGGKSELGAIYSIHLDGTKFTSIFEFEGYNGAAPIGELVVQDSVLYGVTNWGGEKQLGVIFKVFKDGSGFSVLKDLSILNLQPQVSLVLDGSWLYGSAYDLITESTKGTIFKIKTDGSSFTKIFEFDGPHGLYPKDKLTVTGSYIYGITVVGNDDYGQIFKISKDGTEFTKLASLNPHGSLTKINNMLFGTTVNEGSYGYGSIFSINIDGSKYSNLFDFQLNMPGSASGLQLIAENNTLFGLNHIGGTNSMGALFSFSIPPIITSHPKGKTAICEGAESITSISTIGKEPMYQWQISRDTGSSWNNILDSGIDPVYSGWNEPSLKMQNLTPDNAGNIFRCIVFDQFGRSDTSRGTTIVFNIPMNIAAETKDTAVCEGNEATFSLTVNGILPEYNWQENRDGTWIPFLINPEFEDIESNSITVNKTAEKTEYFYRCIIFGSCAVVDTSEVAKLTIQTSPSVVLQPNNFEVCEGKNGFVQINGIGTGLSYQWQISEGTGWTDIVDNNLFSGSNLEMLEINSISKEINNTAFRCLIRGTCPPTDTSDNSILRILDPPRILHQSIDMKLEKGRDTSLFVTPSEGLFKYQWLKSDEFGMVWENIFDNETYEGSFSLELQIKNVTVEQNKSKFRCLVSDDCGNTVLSEIVTLNVNPSSGFSTNQSLLGMKMVPNPATSFCELSFTCPDLGEVVTTIYSVAGCKIQETSSLKKIDEYSTNLNVSEFADGIYYYRCQLNNLIIGYGKLIKE